MKTIRIGFLVPLAVFVVLGTVGCSSNYNAGPYPVVTGESTNQYSELPETASNTQDTLVGSWNSSKYYERGFVLYADGTASGGRNNYRYWSLGSRYDKPTLLLEAGIVNSEFLYRLDGDYLHMGQDEDESKWTWYGREGTAAGDAAAEEFESSHACATQRAEYEMAIRDDVELPRAALNWSFAELDQFLVREKGFEPSKPCASGGDLHLDASEPVAGEKQYYFLDCTVHEK